MAGRGGVPPQLSSTDNFRELVSSPPPVFPELESRPGSPSAEREQDEDEDVDPHTKNFYRMIPEMHNLVRMLNSKRRKHNRDMDKVLARGGNSALTGRDVYMAQKQKLVSAEINSGCGFDAPVNKPYKPFENGVSFEDSTKAVERDTQEVLNRRKTLAEIQHELTSITPVALDQLMLAKAGQYQRKLFVLDLEAYPKQTVRGKAIEVRVQPIVGDPDLYISIAEPPTEREYMWRSLQEGQDVILIHPDDPNYIFGAYYICVVCSSSRCEFELTARMLKPVTHNDDETFVKAQKVMYLSIKSCIKGSDHRRRLCAGGRGIQLHQPETPQSQSPSPLSGARLDLISDGAAGSRRGSGADDRVSRLVSDSSYAGSEKGGGNKPTAMKSLLKKGGGGGQPASPQVSFAASFRGRGASFGAPFKGPGGPRSQSADPLFSPREAAAGTVLPDIAAKGRNLTGHPMGKGPPSMRSKSSMGGGRGKTGSFQAEK